MITLQELVDELAARAGRAIDVEDRRFRLLAHSAHDGPVDDVRRDTILRRAASSAVVARLDALGIAAAREPLRLPPDPGLGMAARICFPLRDRDALLGYVWVVDEPPLADAVVTRLAEALAVVVPALTALRDAEDERRGREQAALAALFAGTDTAPAEALLAPGPVVVAVAAEGSDLTPLRRRAGVARALTGTHDGLAVAVLAGAEPADDPEPVLGVGAPATTLAGAPASHREAVLALRVARAVPAFGPVARFPRLGAHGLLAPLAFAVPPPAPPAALELLAAAPDGPELLATLRAVLDAGEDVAGAAAALHVHRSTLHRRLRRAEQLTGTDLADGRTRLELHAGLVLLELRSGPPR